MRRILLITAGLLLALCVACVFAGYFVGIPRVRDGVQDGVQEAVSTYVAPAIAGSGIAPTAGTYELTEEEVNQAIQAGDPSLSDLQLSISPSGLELRFGDQGQDLSYTATVTAVDGKIDIQAANLTGVPNWIVPTGAISNGVEKGINTYLAENNLVVTSVTMQDGSMTLVLADAPASAGVRSAA